MILGGKTFSKELTYQPKIPIELLGNSFYFRKGNLPILFSVPDDGSDTVLGGIELVKNLESYPRDVAVRSIAKDIYIYVLKIAHVSPGMIIQRIHRSYVSEEIQDCFDNRIKSYLRNVSDSHQFLFLDLHGFTKQPSIGNYDLILGTGHRKTVGQANIDFKFAEFMSQKGYKVYVPGEGKIEGELYMAEAERTEVQKILQMGLKNVIALQIEVSKSFRFGDSFDLDKGKKLSEDMGDFIIQWSSDNFKLLF